MTVGLYKSKGRHLPFLVRWAGEIDPATGKSKRYSKSFRTRAEADEFRMRKQHEIRRTGRRDRPADESLKKLCDDFLRAKKPNVRIATAELYVYTIDRLLKFFGPDRKANTITPKDADLFLAAQVYRQDGQTELSNWSRLQIIAQCGCIFRTAQRWKLIYENPFKEVVKPKATVKKWHHMTVDEYLRLLVAAPDLRWKAFYALAYTSGARVGELFALTWNDIDFEAGIVRIDNRPGSPTMPPFNIKDSEPRKVPLPRHTLDVLAEWQAEAPATVPYILLTADRYDRVLTRWRKIGRVDAKWKNCFMTNNTLRDFKVHAKRAEIQFDGRFTVHTFRKSCAQNWANAGVPPKTLAYWLGHADEKTTLTYYNRVEAAHADIAAKAFDGALDIARRNQTDAHLTREGGVGAGMEKAAETQEAANHQEQVTYGS